MHLLYGLLFLLLTIALALAYAAAALLLLFLACRLLPGRLQTFFRTRRALYLALALVSFHCCLYLKARVEWMGRDNGNLAAKEYWVAGQGVFAWRALWMHAGGHPESWIMRPFVRLQERIYQRGYPLLPEGDGERGVWTQQWLVYPYSRNMLVPKDNHDERTSAATTALLELAWETLEQQATGMYADREMREQYHRNFPGAALYYDAYQGALTGHILMSRKLQATNERLIQRTRALRSWLQSLPEQWATSEATMRFVRRHPKIKAMRQGRQAETMYDIAVNDMLNLFLRYVVRRFCGKEVPGRERTLRSATKTRTEQDKLENFLYSGYFEELTILDTMYPDIPYGKGGEDSYKNTIEEYRQKQREIRQRTEAILQSRLSKQEREDAP